MILSFSTSAGPNDAAASANLISVPLMSLSSHCCYCFVSERQQHSGGLLQVGTEPFARPHSGASGAPSAGTPPASRAFPFVLAGAETSLPSTVTLEALCLTGRSAALVEAEKVLPQSVPIRKSAIWSHAWADSHS